MKQLFAVFVLVSLYTNMLHAQFAKIAGKDILDADGNKIIMKGTNVGFWLLPEGYMFKFEKVNSPRLIDQMICEAVGPDNAAVFWKSFLDTYITEEDIVHIKKLGFNTVRVPFHYRVLTGEGYLGVLKTKEQGYQYLDKIVQWCSSQGLYVILDMHGAPGGQTGDNIDDSYGYPWLFKSDAAQQECIAIWTEIAARYKKEKYVLGYELLNEPLAHYFNKDSLSHLLEPLYKRMVTGIRSKDSKHIIFLGGAQWNTNFSIFSKPFDPNLSYTFHKYWCDTVQGEIQQYVNFREKYQANIWLGESGENTDAWIKSFRSLLDRNEIGWCFWPYKKPESTRGVVSFDLPANYNLLIQYAKSNRSTYEGIRENRPDAQLCMKALMQFIENSKAKNCQDNPGYIDALGLKIPETSFKTGMNTK
ncbi:MAG: glycoside hydrolase family 5 protein [Cytophagaceae bacterium]|jgi:aryl-phospho-beta-D-glucosidase BglC (GH1 family)|nr:glycoside hydrolase family 5 protein [Cytophagaceae bacterium]